MNLEKNYSLINLQMLISPSLRKVIIPTVSLSLTRLCATRLPVLKAIAIALKDITLKMVMAELHAWNAQQESSKARSSKITALHAQTGQLRQSWAAALAMLVSLAFFVQKTESAATRVQLELDKSLTRIIILSASTASPGNSILQLG